MTSIPFTPNPYLKQSKLRQIFEQAPKGAINLGIGQPGEDTPQYIRDAAAEVARSANLGYTLNAGLPELREKVASSVHVEGLGIHNVVITSGVQEALFAMFYILANEQNRILLPNPGFLTYPSLSALQRSEPHYYSLSRENNFRFEAETVLEAIRPDTRAVLLAQPSNPTGSIALQNEYAKLIKGLHELDRPIWVISDEVYHGMTYGEDCPTMMDFWNDYPYLTVLRGASKNRHMTGWRIGWAIVPDLLYKPYVACHQFICTCASSMSQQTLNRVFGTPEDDQWLAAQKDLYSKKRDMVHEVFDSLRPLYGGEGAFYWMLELNDDDLDGKSDEKWVMNTMFEDLVITLPGSAFGTQASGLIRISYGAKTDDLQRALQILNNKFRGK